MGPKLTIKYLLIHYLCICVIICVLILYRFHTAFLEELDGEYHMMLDRHDIDNPHKDKNWSEYGGVYSKNFSIELFLTKPSETK